MDEAVSKSSIPSSPKPDFTIRTMQSDIDSLKQTGGVAAVEQPISVASVAENGVQGYGGPEKAIFQPSGLLAEEQLYQNFKTSAGAKPSGGGVKTILIALFVVALTGGLGFLVYAIASRFLK